MHGDAYAERVFSRTYYPEELDDDLDFTATASVYAEYWTVASSTNTAGAEASATVTEEPAGTGSAYTNVATLDGNDQYTQFAHDSDDFTSDGRSWVTTALVFDWAGTTVSYRAVSSADGDTTGSGQSHPDAYANISFSSP